MYLPPNNLEAYVSFSSKITNLTVDENSLIPICGDFNLSTTEWLQVSDNRYLDPFHVKQKYSDLIFNLSYHNCMQYNTVFNSNNKLLDLIFLNKNEISGLRHCSASLVPEDVHHPCIEFLYDISLNKPLNFNLNTYFNFKKANCHLINREILGIDWHTKLANMSVDGSEQCFHSTINDIVNRRRRCPSSLY